MRKIIVAMLVVAGLLPAGAPAQAQTLPMEVSCTNMFGVVFRPALLTDLPPTNEAVFGSVVGVPSNVTCAGAIVGTAQVTGTSFTCSPTGDEAVCPSRVGLFPEYGDVVVALNTTGTGNRISVARSQGVLTPDAGTGLRWADDPGLAKGLVTCTYAGEGWGAAVLAPMRLVHMSCKGAGEATAQEFRGVANSVTEVLLSVAGNLVTTTEPGFTELCPDPTVTLNATDLFCFRSVILQGEWHVSQTLI
jgi:hypothetical protein